MLSKTEVLIPLFFSCGKFRRGNGSPISFWQQERGGSLMSQILVSHLTFSYECSFDVIFDDVSFTLDTDWKLGVAGRNGKGKTTFLRLLQGKYPYQGTISASVAFDYFPYPAARKDKERMASELLEEWKAG